MQYTKPGNSDLNVSRICMGCMGFGDAGFHTTGKRGGGNQILQTVNGG